LEKYSNKSIGFFPLKKGDRGILKSTSSEAWHGARRHYRVNEVCLLWERLSASIIAAGKPLPQKKT
jgi:hypothetical protein